MMKGLASGCAGMIVLLSGMGVQAAEKSRPEDTRPEHLLPQALALARTLPDGHGYGNWAKPLAVLRIAATMRLRGMHVEAAAAFEEGAAMTRRLGEPATRDEMMIELCREFMLLGKTAQARQLAPQVTFRNYSAVAWYVTVRAALEANKPDEAEAILQEAVSPGQAARGKDLLGDAFSTRGAVRVAVRMNRLELARKLIDTMQDAFWKSAALGDLAETLARERKIEAAFRVAGEIPDTYMGVLAYVRLGTVFSQQKAAEPLSRALDRLKATVVKLPTEVVRDCALRLAVGKFAAAGNESAAARVAKEITNPTYRLLASCEIVQTASQREILEQLQRCPEQEQPLAAEVLTVAYGGRGMSAAAREASTRVTPGWPRCRALCEAAQRMAETQAKTDAAVLLAAATETLSEIRDSSGRCCARIRLALCEHRAGNAQAVDRHLEAARGEVFQLAPSDGARALLPQVVEAASATGRRQLARSIVLEALKRDPDAVLRNRLVPMLISAGDPDAALAECARSQLGDSYARRLVAYRLALAGKPERAVKYAATWVPGERAEALADIALAQVARPPVKSVQPKVVGVSLHGSWRSWFPRLERLGLDWELMPFSAPYEEGPEGLAAKYSMLAYPGTGGHISHVAVAGAEHLRQYLYAGGGFFGICAGQFLATGQHLVPCDTIYLRGKGPHQVQIRKNHVIAVHLPSVVIIPRQNGGFLIPRPGCEVIGWYDTIERYAALVASDCGLGRVVAFSPHPEGSQGFDSCDRLCISATLWATGGLP